MRCPAGFLRRAGLRPAVRDHVAGRFRGRAIPATLPRLRRLHDAVDRRASLAPDRDAGPPFMTNACSENNVDFFGHGLTPVPAAGDF
jgi:hypothetical protein